MGGGKRELGGDATRGNLSPPLLDPSLNPTARLDADVARLRQGQLCPLTGEAHGLQGGQEALVDGAARWCGSCGGPR